MSVSWAFSYPEVLRAHHARDAADQAGPLPGHVIEAILPENGGFRGGLLLTPAHRSTDDILVYFHGGGFVAGSPETHRSVTTWLAKLSGMRVLSARYRLAPEHPFPAQREDARVACAAACFLGDGPAERARMFLAGDSAGACVALWGLHALDPADRARVKGLVLLYGAYGLTTGDSISSCGTPENGLDSDTLAIMYRRLGGANVTRPIDFAREITEPTYVLAAGLDALFDDSAMLFRSLESSNPANTFVVADGQDHGFLKGTGHDPLALSALEQAVRWVDRLNAAGNTGVGRRL